MMGNDKYFLENHDSYSFIEHDNWSFTGDRERNLANAEMCFSASFIKLLIDILFVPNRV